jgi:hypothetical protein
MLVDLNVGLSQRDGTTVDPLALVQAAQSAGLDGLVLTQSSLGFPDLGAYRAAAEPAGLSLFAALHVPTNRGLVLCVLPDPSRPLGEEWAPGESGLLDAEKVIDAVEDLGGVTIALRPYDREVAKPMGDHIFSLVGLHACETQSGRLADAVNALALEAASNLELPCVGSSSADGTDGLGRAATLFRVTVKNEADLVEAIRHGDVWPVAISHRMPRVDGEKRADGRGDRGERGDRGGDRGGDRPERGERSSGGDRPERGERSGGGDRGAGGGARAEGREGGRRRGRRGGRGRGGGERGPSERVAGERGPSERGPSERAEGQPRREPRGDAQPADVSHIARPPRGEDGRRRRRGGRGRTGGGGGGASDDIGNRLAPTRSHLDDDAGNRIAPEPRQVAEDIGNRLRPGQESAFHAFRQKHGDVGMDVDDEDSAGNR